MPSLPVRNCSATLVNLMVFTCGYNSCSPGMPCQPQRRPRSEGAASFSTRLSSSSDTTGSLRLSQTQRLLDVNDEMTEDKTKAAVSRSTHLEPTPSQCRSAGAACKPQSVSRCLGGHTASGSYRRTTTVHYSVSIRKQIGSTTILTSLQTGTGFSALKVNLLCRF